MKLISLDNFYKNPDKIYNFALITNSYKFDKIGLFGGMSFVYNMNSNYKYTINKYFEKLLDCTIDIDSIHCEFEVVNKNCPNKLYFDEPNIWRGIIFLSKNAQPKHGIGFYQHKNGEKKMTEVNDKSTINMNYDDNWLLEDNIGNIFNRLIIFNSNYFFKLTDFLGDDLYTGLLIQSFIFKIIY